MDLMLVVLVTALAAGLAVAGVVLVRWRRGGEEPYYHFRCAGCRRRLRYRARQAGHAGQCNHCGYQITFPPVGQSVD